MERPGVSNADHFQDPNLWALRTVLKWVRQGLKDRFRDGIGCFLLPDPASKWMGFKTSGLGQLSAPGKEDTWLGKIPAIPTP